MVGSGENPQPNVSHAEKGSLPENMGKRRSSVFTRARMSFVRSNGQRGASVETLRGTTGADFEGKAIVVRGQGSSCGCFGGNANKEVLVLIKGPFCFVYTNENSSSPKYAISLAHMKCEVRQEAHGRSTVLLETCLGDVNYEFTFVTSEDTEIARRFASVVRAQASAGETAEVKKRLGHEHLLVKRSSVRYAESIALKKIKDQPEAPVSPEELMSTIPIASL